MESGKNKLLEMTGAQLRAFLAVAEYGGFGTAARELNVAQPTVSKAVRGLERKVGPLFDRSKGRAAVLSPVGRLLKDEAATVIQLLREIERKIEQSQAGRPLIRVAIGEYLYNRCKDAVSDYAAEHTDMSVQLEMIHSRSAAFRALRLGDVDLVFMSQFGNVQAKPRFSSQASMKLYRSPQASEVNSARLILPILSAQEKEGFLTALRQLGIGERNDFIFEPNYYSIKSLCMAGKGKALIFEEDAWPDVEAGRLIEVLPDSVKVTRGCFYYGESRILEGVARFLVSATS